MEAAEQTDKRACTYVFPLIYSNEAYNYPTMMSTEVQVHVLLNYSGAAAAAVRTARDRTAEERRRGVEDLMNELREGHGTGDLGGAGNINGA